MSFKSAKKKLNQNQYSWLITGVAGFIGSNLLEFLLLNNQKVTGLDNFSTGFEENLNDVKSIVTKSQWSNFRLIHGDIRNYNDCIKSLKDIDFVLHQAALGSVPRSIEDPILTNDNNLTGFLNIIEASRNSKVNRFIFAASSSTYGDSEILPKKEEVIGKPISPYAVTKLVNEIYAEVYSKTYNLRYVGLRYFNVFGKRQSPNGSYAAVIPKWTIKILNGKSIDIYGDGETSRDFCFIDNVVQANILAALSDNKAAYNQIYNVANGGRTSLNELFNMIKNNANLVVGKEINIEPNYKEFRAGDVMHSQADISKIKLILGYNPSVNIDEGIAMTTDYFFKNNEKFIKF